MVPSGTIGKLVNLETLDLSENNLDSLFPKDFGNLVNLKKLFLQHNSIKIFPKCLCALTNLQILKLNDNGLTEIDAGIGNSHFL